MVGMRFGALTVLSEIKERDKNNFILYLCRCDCGNQKAILGSSMRDGRTQSCGCLHSLAVTKHGMDGTPIYRTWIGMKTRCLNPKSPIYHQYGGRGISICQRWLENFDNFLADMGNRPDGMSIDRIDVDGNYEPSNCRWATPVEQANNRRNNKIFNLNGKPYTAAQYSKEFNISYKKAVGILTKSSQKEQAE
jgi:hypothetical protein